ncbi:MAG: DEAD/DEAH box helicase [Polaromonas sp.]|nr:DEAD/DEAH box helicase [Polaromonas sp.]
MKYEFPENHGLPDSIGKHLLFWEEGKPALSDVQHASLAAGIGRGESMLVVSPTSTGKTLIGLWAIARSLEAGCNTVYLVTHRALAKQKFEDFKSQLLTQYLGGNKSSLIVATGDYVEDAEEQSPAEPLRAPLLVATYEKFLALLSASGVPQDMKGTVIICDEIQLIGDPSRGQSVEVLLTLLKNAGWRQFVGLSAVLQPKDAQELANWLQVKLIVEHRREKHLRYECWTTDQMLTASTQHPDNIVTDVALPIGAGLDPVTAIVALLKAKNPPLPIIVFCMKKQDTYDLARQFVDTVHAGQKGQLSLAFDGLPETSASTFLASILNHRVASHNADLMDEERDVVERLLLEGKLDVVFATTTLAAGVNFPLGAAVFADWLRWDGDKRMRMPIAASEFHNMAGRVGRMGFVHEDGRVIFFASTAQLPTARRYLAIGELPAIEPRVTPARFNQLVLQLVSSKLCSNREELQKLLCTTFSALREEDKNITAFKTWPGKIHSAVDELLEKGLLLETSIGLLVPTPVGKAIGHSALLPETGLFLLQYIVKNAKHLITLLPANGKQNDALQLSMLLFCCCLSSPEFRPQGGVKPTRFLPFPLQDKMLFDPKEYVEHLAEPVWQADPLPINAAWLSQKWIDGTELKALEDEVRQLSAGMLREMFRNLAWVLEGLSGIANAAADKRVPLGSRPPSLRITDEMLDAIAKLPRAVRRLSFRVQEGLPDDALWLTSLCGPGAPYRLARHEILALRARGLATPEALMLGSKEANASREQAFSKVKPSPIQKANWIRDACREWKIQERKRASERHLKRARRCIRVDLLAEFYLAKGTAFEAVFESILVFLKIDFKKLDDRTKTGAPDYLISLKDSPPLVMELKSKEGDKLVDYNKAVEVLAASEVHGYKDAFCVTLCHPGVDPSVPSVVASCGRLSVVESNDLGEALVRICENVITEQQLWQWLATPGQALAADLPYREYG